MTTNSKIDYHLSELQIAMHPESSGYAMPSFLNTDQAILDIGCGVGQTFVAAKNIHGKFLVGLDIDIQSQKWGNENFSYITFVNAGADDLPFADDVFNLVISRVSLPYTNIPRAIAEIRRVLKKGGRVWLTLHSFEKTWTRWKRSVVSLHIKDVIYCSYVILNGIIFNLCGRLIPWPLSGHRESFQSASGMHRAMLKAGFVDVEVGTRGASLVCAAYK